MSYKPEEVMLRAVSELRSELMILLQCMEELNSSGLLNDRFPAALDSMNGAAKEIRWRLESMELFVSKGRTTKLPNQPLVKIITEDQSE